MRNCKLKMKLQIGRGQFAFCKFQFAIPCSLRLMRQIRVHACLNIAEFAQGIACRLVHCINRRLATYNPPATD
jgi:hypothetical protein